MEPKVKRFLIISFLLIVGLNGFGQEKLDKLIISGIINQTLDYSYKVEIKFVKLKVGETSGTTYYSLAECIGILTFLYKVDNRYFFKETFDNEDKKKCANNGMIVIQLLKGNQYAYNWYYPNKEPGSSGILVKGSLK